MTTPKLTPLHLAVIDILGEWNIIADGPQLAWIWQRKVDERRAAKRDAPTPLPGVPPFPLPPWPKQTAEEERNGWGWPSEQTLFRLRDLGMIAKVRPPDAYRTRPGGVCNVGAWVLTEAGARLAKERQRAYSAALSGWWSLRHAAERAQSVGLWPRWVAAGMVEQVSEFAPGVWWCRRVERFAGMIKVGHFYRHLATGHQSSTLCDDEPRPESWAGEWFRAQGRNLIEYTP